MTAIDLDLDLDLDRERAWTQAPQPGPAPDPRPPLDLSPGSAYELVTRQMVEATQRDVAEIKSRINNLMVMVAGAVVVDIVLRLAGLT